MAEILSILWRNRLRTALTAFSISWGIFILVLLMGLGKGLENGATQQFSGDAANSIWIFSRRTSLPYNGLKPGRKIQFTDRDYKLLEGNLPGGEHLAARFNAAGNAYIKFKNKHAEYRIISCLPEYKHLEALELTSGRFINNTDIEQNRKVVVISKLVKAFLFGPHKMALGQTIEIGRIAYKIVGVFDDAGGQRDLSRVYIPLTTARKIYQGADRLDMMALLVKPDSLFMATQLQNTIRQKLAQQHHFDPEDTRALWVSDGIKQFKDVLNLLNGIKIFHWVVGIGTLLAGVVGVGNVMLIGVRERTKEFGIRKALGAKPLSIVWLVVQEGLLLTIGAGWLGMVAGVSLINYLRNLLPATDYFANPEVNYSFLLIAIGILAMAGVLATVGPALKAARVKPVVAMRAV